MYQKIFASDIFVPTVSVMENGYEKETFISSLLFFLLIFRKFSLFLTDKKMALTCGKIYSRVLDLSEGKGYIRKKTIKNGNGNSFYFYYP